MTTTNRFKKLVSSPLLYAGWALFVVVALVVSYAMDPYVFGFAALILGGASLGVAALGFLGAWFSRAAGWRPLAAIFGYVLLTFLAFALAFALLRTFNWA